MQKLSIITINYNNLEGLKKTVESVVNQTWHEFEYIVIDGGSTDGSASYIETQSNKIDYWISEPDTGIYNAMNKGVVKSTGEYLLFLNSGDHFYKNEVLEKNHQYIANYDLVYFDVQMIGEMTTEIVTYPITLRFSDLFFGSLPHPATFIKKELFASVGLYDENLKIVSDWKFFILALYRHNCSYFKVSETLCVFYLDGISSYTDYFPERKQVMEEFFNGYIQDYEEFLINRRLVKTNRFKLLQEIEKTTFGKKIVSLIFRTYVFLFSKKNLKEILKEN